MFAATVDQRVFEDPADAGGVRAHFGADPGGKFALYLVEILQHPRSRPVRIGAVFKNHVYVGVAELREAANRFGAGD